jgi:hypothetical protein
MVSVNFFNERLDIMIGQLLVLKSIVESPRLEKLIQGIITCYSNFNTLCKSRAVRWLTVHSKSTCQDGGARFTWQGALSVVLRNAETFVCGILTTPFRLSTRLVLTQ